MDWKKLTLTTAVVALAATACGDDNGTAPTTPEGEATVVGRVENTTASGSALTEQFTTAQTAGTAETVAVVAVQADGSLSTLAQADVAADGSFRIEGVPSGQADLAVVAYTGDDEVGRVLLYERARAGATLTAEPINLETTVEGRSWARLRATGSASSTNTAEVALMTRADADASAEILTQAQVDAVAAGLAEAGSSWTRVFAQSGASLDARARAELLRSAAAAYAASRHAGTRAEVAHENFVNASFDALVAAGARADALVMATAAAASTADARTQGALRARGTLVSEAVRLNLRARERLAANVGSSAGASLAADIQQILAGARAELRGATTAAEIRARLDAASSAAADVTVAAVLDLLVPGVQLGLRSEVETKARAAVEAARLGARLQGAANADAAAQAVANYRSAVRAAVDAMIQASGRTDVDAEAMTSLYIAAHGGAWVR